MMFSIGVVLERLHAMINFPSKLAPNLAIYVCYNRNSLLEKTFIQKFAKVKLMHYTGWWISDNLLCIKMIEIPSFIKHSFIKHGNNRDKMETIRQIKHLIQIAMMETFFIDFRLQMHQLPLSLPQYWDLTDFVYVF